MQKLGQHFLKDKSVLEKIITAIDFGINENIIEVGPGHGELTNLIVRELKKNNGKLVMIEKDSKLFLELQENFNNSNHIILEGDALKIVPKLVDSKEFKNKKYKIVGNIPYYITGYLLRVIGESKSKPQICVFTIQNEVADRINAKPPHMNLLAASVQIWADTKIISRVPRGAFSPPPKVQSAVIKLTTKTMGIPKSDLLNYYKFLHTIFKQPRKTILNNLVSGLNKNREELVSGLIQLNLDPIIRPQNLKIEEIIKLFELFYKND